MDLGDVSAVGSVYSAKSHGNSSPFSISVPSRGGRRTVFHLYLHVVMVKFCPDLEHVMNPPAWINNATLVQGAESFRRASFMVRASEQNRVLPYGEGMRDQRHYFSAKRLFPVLQHHTVDPADLEAAIEHVV